MRDTNTAASATSLPRSTIEPDERDREMFRLRTVEGLTLGAIAARFGVGPERVRQLINRHARKTTGHPPDPGGLSKTARAIRRAADLARAEARAAELISAWREGEEPQQLARRLGLHVRCVREVIRTGASDADRAIRSTARRSRGVSEHAPRSAHAPASRGAGRPRASRRKTGRRLGRP